MPVVDDALGHGVRGGGRSRPTRGVRVTVGLRHSILFLLQVFPVEQGRGVWMWKRVAQRRSPLGRWAAGEEKDTIILLSREVRMDLLCLVTLKRSLSHVFFAVSSSPVSCISVGL